MTSRKRELYRQLAASVEDLERLIGEPVDEFENGLDEEGIRTELDTAEVYTDAVEELKALRSTLEGIRQEHLNDHGLSIFAKGLVASYADIGISPATENSVEFEPFLVASIESIGDKIKEYGTKAWEAVKALAKRIKEWVLGIFKRDTDEAADEVKEAADSMNKQKDEYTDWDDIFDHIRRNAEEIHKRHEERTARAWEEAVNSRKAGDAKRKAEADANQHRHAKQIKFRNAYRGFIGLDGKFTLNNLEGFKKALDILNRLGNDIAKRKAYTSDDADKFVSSFTNETSGIAFNGHRPVIHHDESRHTLISLMPIPLPNIDSFDEPRRMDIIRCSREVLELRMLMAKGPIIDLSVQILDSKEKIPYIEDYLKLFADANKLCRLYIVGLRSLMHGCKSAKE